jgi:hypothetical protein
VNVNSRTFPFRVLLQTRHRGKAQKEGSPRLPGQSDEENGVDLRCEKGVRI